MSTTQRSIVVDLPVSTVYNQWTQFEEFPHFMEGVERVTQLDDRRLRWVAEIAGSREEWDAEIVDQEPERRISWRALPGTSNAGVVAFQPLGPSSTRVTLDLHLGFVSSQVEGDLNRFKKFIESRTVETGAGRGSI